VKQKASYRHDSQDSVQVLGFPVFLSSRNELWILSAGGVGYGLFDPFLGDKTIVLCHVRNCHEKNNKKSSLHKHLLF